MRDGSIYGIVGIINVNGANYLAVIFKTAKVAVINRSNIYRVENVRLISFASGVTTPANSVAMLNEVKALLEDGFYFSYSYDVTCSRQRRVKWKDNSKQDSLELIGSDNRYFWNYNLY